MRERQNNVLIVLICSLTLTVVLTFLLPPIIRPVISSFLFNLFISLLFLISLIGLVNYSLKRFPRKEHKFKHLFILLPAIIFLLAIMLLLRDYLFHQYTHTNFRLNVESILYISVIAGIFIVTCFEGSGFFNYWKKYIIHSEQVEKANLLAQYEALRNQLNPHFLFNGLNTLILFIENNDRRASQYAQHMSDFLKYLLTHHSEKLVTLEEELTLVNQYIYLQSARFDENLHVNINIPAPYLNYHIPPLTLQILIENAIKHNIISSLNKLNIKISQNDHYIFVTNNIQRRKDVISAGIGIQNIKGRYSLFTDREVIIEENKSNFTVGVPIIDKLP